MDAPVGEKQVDMGSDSESTGSNDAASPEDTRVARAAKARRRARQREAAERYADPLVEEREAMLKEVQRKFQDLPSIGDMKREAIVEQEAGLREDLLNLQSFLDSELERLCTKLSRPEGRRLTVSDLRQRIRALRTLPDKDVAVLDVMEDQLRQLISYENGKEFAQTRGNAMRKRISDRLATLDRMVEGAHRYERNLKLVERVKLLLQLHAGATAAEVEEITVKTMSSVEMEVTPAAQLVLAPPMNLARRMERLFHVIVDRVPRARRTYLIAGREEDVNTAVAFFNTADFSGSIKTKVADQRLVPQIIGRGGAGIKQLENKFCCFFDTRDREFIIYGAPDKAEKAKEYIESLKVEQRPVGEGSITVPVEHGAMARSLRSAFSRTVRDLEAAHNVTIHVFFGAPPTTVTEGSPGFGGDITQPETATSPQLSLAGGTTPGSRIAGQSPSVVIRSAGRGAAVEAAKNDLEKFLATLRILEVPCGSLEAAQRLFSRVSPNGEIDLAAYSTRSGGSPSGYPAFRSVGDRFCDLVGTSPDVAFVRWGANLALVGTPENVQTVLTPSKELVEIAGYTAIRIPITSTQLPSFSQRRVAVIAEETGASVFIRKGRAEDGSAAIEVVGSEEAKAAAEARIKDIIAKEACVSTIVFEEKAVVDQLLARQAAAIRDLEQQYGTRISVNRADRTCFVTGSSENVRLSEEALRAVEQSCRDMITQTIPIPSAAVIGRLIGAKGANINNIREKAHVLSIDINDRDMKVIIKGSPDSVKIAEQMVLECFAERENPQRDNSRKETATTSATGRRGRANVAPATTVYANVNDGVGLGWGEDAVVVPTTGTAPVESADRRSGWMPFVNAAPSPPSSGNAGFFPSLDEAAAHQCKNVLV